ncbi:hypothetical protein [Modestobacter sp. NPDC049651]|uniref:hypothetical protein n=1 Tax=unclassified Modestobacter TaxID=2643866 RepID=UPI0033C8932C
MTATLAPTTSSPAPGHRAPAGRPPLAALSVVAGGVLFAVGNALHPMRHDDAALEAPTWLAAHLTFGAGAVLMAAGIGVLFRRLAPSRLATAGLAVLWVGLVLMPIGSITEGYVAPLMGHSHFHELEESIAWFSALAGTATLLGPLLVCVGALRHRLLPAAVALALPAITVGGVLAGGVLPVEGWGIIPGTVVFGLGMAAAGWVGRRPA